MIIKWINRRSTLSTSLSQNQVILIISFIQKVKGAEAVLAQEGVAEVEVEIEVKAEVGETVSLKTNLRLIQVDHFQRIRICKKMVVVWVQKMS